MSRIAKIPIDVPKGVEVSIVSGQISVKGPLGTIGRADDRAERAFHRDLARDDAHLDRKSTRLNSSHEWSSYAVFCLKKKNEAIPSFVSGDMAKAGKGLLEGTLQAGTSAVSDQLLDLVGLGCKSGADTGKDTRDYLAA